MVIIDNNNWDFGYLAIVLSCTIRCSQIYCSYLKLLLVPLLIASRTTIAYSQLLNVMSKREH